VQFSSFQSGGSCALLWAFLIVSPRPTTLRRTG
jgi:hypothetical protein